MNAVKRGLAFLLLFALVCGMLPVSMAEDIDHNGESVLTSIGHKLTDSKTPDSEHKVTLTTLSYGTEPIDLSDGIKIEWEDGYTGVVANFVDYMSTDLGSSAEMQVTYSLLSDAEPRPIYTTIYTIAIVGRPYEGPEFSGTISKSALLPNTINFGSGDFEAKYDANDGDAIGAIRIEGANPDFGTLLLGTESYAGSLIAMTDLRDLSFKASDSGSWNYRVYAYEGSKMDSPIGQVTLEITIDKVTPPTIKSSIAKSVNALSSVTFTASDFTGACNMNDGSLSKIEITPINTEYGTWYSGTTAFTDAKEFTSSTISNLKFTGSAAGTATFKWRVSNEAGYSDYGTGSIAISYHVSQVTYTVNKNAKVTFDATDFNTVCTAATGAKLSYVKFTLPSATYGKLYYNYTSSSSYDSLVKSTTEYNRSSSPYLAYVTFVPTTSYTGKVTVSYTGSDVNGVSYSGEIVITVQDITIASVAYETGENETAIFEGDDFDDVCDAAGLETLSYIKITELPKSTYGKLYYNYSSDSSKGTAVSTSTKLYYKTTNTPYLDKVAFVPYSNYTGIVSIKYTGYDTDGQTYTGTIKITVEDSDVDTVTYETGKNETIVFDGDDFNDVCDDADYDTLNYIKISSLPSSSYGKLYYNYSSSSSKGTAVTTSTKLYYDHDDTPYLDKVAFIPYSSYTGTVTISYTGYDTDGESFSGTLKIVVGEADVDTVTYDTDKNETVVFDGDDFNDVCDDAGYETLNYIKISALPSSSYGKLYYGYSSSSSKGTAVTTSTKLYYDTDDTPYLDKVAFVPYSGYTGTVTISYTGYDTDGDSYSGTIKITVGDTDVDAVTYSADMNETIVFDGDDFDDVSDDAGYETLNYIKISALPSSSYGKLYYGYSSSSSKGTAVTTSTKLYYDHDDTPYLDKVAFVPASGYSGTVTISYTGYDTDGDSYSGTIKITYNSVKDITYSTSNNLRASFSDTDFNTVCKAATGENLSYVKFTLPQSSAGTLFYNYYAQGSYTSLVIANTAYYRSSSPYLSSVSFVPVYGYTGTVNISYTGYATDGDTFSGTVKVTVTGPKNSSYFNDVNTNYYWAVEAVDYLYGQGVVKGTGSSTYGPGTNITRADFIVMLYRALGLSATTNGNFNDVAKGSYYYDSVAVAKALGIAQGSNGYFNPTKPLTRQDAMVFVYRALQAKGVKVTEGTSSDLSVFNDRSSISSYATTSVATLVKAGVIVGAGNKINPSGNLTRAEMAVILHRVLKK